MTTASPARFAAGAALDGDRYFEVGVDIGGERHYSAAPGLAGGLAGASAHSVIRRSDGREEGIPSKALTVLNKGDRVIVQTPRGGGYGDPKRREQV